MYRQNLRSHGLALGFVVFASLAKIPDASAYERITDSEEVVLNKLFTKKGKVELDGKFGLILNTSYTRTFTATGGVSYFWSEEWGFSGEAILALNSDKAERYCIERFYNRAEPSKLPSPDPGECPQPGTPNAAFSQATDPNNFGPAYVPIRELKYILTGNAVWNPIYGKQIILLSATNYFDFFVKVGAGVAMSDFYPLEKNIKSSGRPSRGAFNKDLPRDKNPGTFNESDIGTDGRPPVEAQTSPLLHLAAGQRFHFLKRFMISGSLDNYTIFGNGIENFFTISGGAGIRF